MSLLPLVLALFFIPLLWLVGSRIRHFETPWKDPWCDIFLKSRWYEDLKNNFPKCLTSKYTHTNTQIHKYTNTVCHTLLWLVGSRIRHFETLWKEPWCDTFLKSRWYEDLKNNVPKCLTYNTQIQIHKYTNTVWVKFEDRPNMCCIFEKVMVQSGASSLAKHGGAYFSVVYGSIEDLVAAPGHCKPQVR